MAELVCLDCYRTYDPQQGHFCVNNCWIPGAAVRNIPLQDVADEISRWTQDAPLVNNEEFPELTSVNTAFLNINSDINLHPHFSNNAQYALSNQVEIVENSESVAECSTNESYAVAGPSHAQLNCYKCIFCLKEFDYMGGVISHAESHKGPGGFTCDICEKVIKTYSIFEKHIDRHAGIEPYKCKYLNCEKRFSLRSSLSAHMLTHKGNKTHFCNICEYKFTRKSYLEEHMLMHYSKNAFACDVCEKKLSSKRSLKRHKILHCRKKKI